MAIIFTLSCSENEPKPGYYPGEGLISYFPFDGNINDLMGNTVGGTNHNSAIFTSGKFGEAVTFNGINEYVDYTARTYQTNNEVSVALWFKTHLTGGAHPLAYSAEFRMSIINTDASVASTLVFRIARQAILVQFKALKTSIAIAT
ncbi:MAG: hypothetical protein GY751_14540 [Bacteroidetes bacterium]|nr:hypothetical protein [Bacteroidota bacterium]